MKRMGEGSRAGGGVMGAAVALAAGIVCAWPAPTWAQTAPLTLTVTPADERLERVSREVREAVRVIDSDDGDERAHALWGMYRAIARRGDPALIEWAFELQSVVRGRKGNYLHAFCWVLDEHQPGKARAFAAGLARRGIAIGPNTGHYERLDHLDPAAPIPELPAGVGDAPIGRYVDAFADATYDLSYRPERKGQLSKLLQVTYDDGTRMDIDIRLISDDFDPAGNQSLGRLYVGLGGRLYPLRMDRLSTPRLWAAKHAALAEMRRYNQTFEELVTISTSGTMVPLGLAVPVQQPAAGAVRSRPGRAAKAPRSTRPAAARGGGGRNFEQDLLSMRRQKGLGDIPAGTRAEAETLGRAWVNGKDVKRFDLPGGGYALTDGTRTFRLQYKPRAGVWKANFQENTFIPGRARGIEVKNIHMDITDMVAR